MSESRKDLEHAFRLIKRDETEEAQQIIRPILDEEPDNVDAWWLLAYAVTEPREVRSALLNVLRLDPDYTNAPKAREMLDKLNAEYPPGEDEIAQFPELAAAHVETPSLDQAELDVADLTPSEFEPFSEEEEPFSEDIFGDVFADSEIPELDEDLFVSEDPFSDLRAETMGPEADEGVDAVPHDSEPRSSALEEEIRLALAADDSKTYDEETLAKLEEQTAQRRGRTRRLAQLLGALLLVALVLVLVVILVRPGEEDESDEPSPVDVVTVDSPSVATTIGAVTSQATNLGSSREVVVAKSDLGDAILLQICDRPGPGLPAYIAQGMSILAQQSAALQDELEAVGVDVAICGDGSRDTLYRAFATVADAQRYANNEIGLTEFQTTWKRS
jgi:hypothetical protein